MESNIDRLFREVPTTDLNNPPERDKAKIVGLSPVLSLISSCPAGDFRRMPSVQTTGGEWNDQQ
jgi:hypothetical protein